MPRWRDLIATRTSLGIGSLIGFFIGVLPGAGATAATMMSYGVAKKMSKHPETFGKGALDGVAAAAADEHEDVLREPRLGVHGRDVDGVEAGGAGPGRRREGVEELGRPVQRAEGAEDAGVSEQAVEAANVVVLMVDASQDISDQDAHIAGFCIEAGRALVLAVNKWDAVDTYRRDQVKQDIQRKLNFLGFAKVHYISALKGQGVASVLQSVDKAYAAAMVKLATPKLTRVLLDAVQKQAPPRHGNVRPKLRYAHQGGSNPPVVVIHGNALEHVPPAYVRYLEHVYLEAFKLQGTPLRIQFKIAKNPYVDKD